VVTVLQEPHAGISSVANNYGAVHIHHHRAGV